MFIDESLDMDKVGDVRIALAEAREELERARGLPGETRTLGAIRFLELRLQSLDGDTPKKSPQSAA
ncbi:hypothetical protein [Palleronia caenipelagi]|uniref:Uncharacterized protein n=1 Tax=Palleronia caenipelagi TaxID=2489174 RepID=A0A547PW46_9RHOB|nr:hypothetical protein [Palleronia caenipelagi]TRD18338.1 hypothetical protein FEV53_11830 [Palleronia caenipelagi]